MLLSRRTKAGLASLALLASLGVAMLVVGGSMNSAEEAELSSFMCPGKSLVRYFQQRTASPFPRLLQLAGLRQDRQANELTVLGAGGAAFSDAPLPHYRPDIKRA
jgi:hypothetical protein